MSDERTPRSEKPPRKRKKRRPGPDLGSFGELSWNLPPDPGQPAWAPSKAESSSVPEAVRQPLRDFILPIYQRSVLQAADPLEQSLGVTAAHLLWLEVLEQFSQKQRYLTEELLLGSDASRAGQIGQVLRVLETKVRVGHLLVRLQELRTLAAARVAATTTRVLNGVADAKRSSDRRAASRRVAAVVSPPGIAKAYLDTPAHATTISPAVGQKAASRGGQDSSNPEESKVVDQGAEGPQ